jgi:hypothetical protein
MGFQLAFLDHAKVFEGRIKDFCSKAFSVDFYRENQRYQKSDNGSDEEELKRKRPWIGFKRRLTTNEAINAGDCRCYK